MVSGRRCFLFCLSGYLCYHLRVTHYSHLAHLHPNSLSLSATSFAISSFLSNQCCLVFKLGSGFCLKQNKFIKCLARLICGSTQELKSNVLAVLDFF